MRCEKREISQKRTEALISRPFTGNLAPNPSSNSPFTDNGFAVKKSARELNLCFTGSREGDIAITALSIDNGYSQLATRILVYRDPKPTPMGCSSTRLRKTLERLANRSNRFVTGLTENINVLPISAVFSEHLSFNFYGLAAGGVAF